MKVNESVKERKKGERWGWRERNGERWRKKGWDFARLLIHVQRLTRTFVPVHIKTRTVKHNFYHGRWTPTTNALDEILC